MDSEFWREVGRLKAVHRRVSLADCCALTLASRLGASLVSADRHVRLSTDKLGAARGHELVFSSNLPGCFGRRLHWGEARANLRLPSQGRPDIFNPLPGRVQSYGGRLCFSDAVAQLKPSFHSLPVLRVPLFPKAGKNRFQDNARDQHGRGREIERNSASSRNRKYTHLLESWIAASRCSVTSCGKMGAATANAFLRYGSFRNGRYRRSLQTPNSGRGRDLPG